MTWSYNLATLQTTPKDMVRLTIGDVDSACPQLQDEEINLTLSAVNLVGTAFCGAIYGAAAMCCRSLASHMSRLADQTSGTSKINFSQRAKAYSARADKLEELYAARGGALPYAGGISVTDVMNQQEDPDRVSPNFGIGMMDNDLPEPVFGIEPLDVPEAPGR